jgi:hypothetical protein
MPVLIPVLLQLAAADVPLREEWIALAKTELDVMGGAPLTADQKTAIDLGLAAMHKALQTKVGVLPHQQPVPIAKEPRFSTDEEPSSSP